MASFNEFQASTTSSENYLSKNKFLQQTDPAKHYILEYLNDSVEQLLEVKNANPKIDVMEFFTEYFKSVKQGNHIVFREYSFISSTPYNRACFIQKFLDTYNYMISREDYITIHEYHSLILLLSFDFPVECVINSLKIISNEEHPTGLFKDFIYAFQFQFYYKEFVMDAKDIFDGIEKSKKSNENESSETFSKPFFELLETLSNKVSYSFPDKKVMKDVLSGKQKWKFYDFLNDLAVDSRTISGIGKLPNKNQLSEIQSKPVEPIKETKIENQDSKSKTEQKNEQTDSNKSSSDDDSSDTDT